MWPYGGRAQRSGLAENWGGGRREEYFIFSLPIRISIWSNDCSSQSTEAVESTQQEMASDLLLAAVSNYVSFQ